MEEEKEDLFEERTQTLHAYIELLEIYNLFFERRQNTFVIIAKCMGEVRRSRLLSLDAPVSSIVLENEPLISFQFRIPSQSEEAVIQFLYGESVEIEIAEVLISEKDFTKTETKTHAKCTLPVMELLFDDMHDIQSNRKAFEIVLSLPVYPSSYKLTISYKSSKTVSPYPKIRCLVSSLWIESFSFSQSVETSNRLLSASALRRSVDFSEEISPNKAKKQRLTSPKKKQTYVRVANSSSSPTTSRVCYACSNPPDNVIIESSPSIKRLGLSLNDGKDTPDRKIYSDNNQVPTMYRSETPTKIAPWFVVDPIVLATITNTEKVKKDIQWLEEQSTALRQRWKTVLEEAQQQQFVRSLKTLQIVKSQVEENKELAQKHEKNGVFTNWESFIRNRRRHTEDASTLALLHAKMFNRPVAHNYDKNIS